MNHTTGAQRHNKRQDKIWETYKAQEAEKDGILSKHHLPLHKGTEAANMFIAGYKAAKKEEETT